jgi:hypothetical protein
VSSPVRRQRSLPSYSETDQSSSVPSALAPAIQLQDAQYPGDDSFLDTKSVTPTGVRYTYKHYTITVPPQLQFFANSLAKNQVEAIKTDVLNQVKVITRVQIVGWLQKEPRMVCVMMNLPPNFTKIPETVSHLPLSWVMDVDNALATTMVIPMDFATNLATEQNQADLFPKLDKLYDGILPV